MTTYAEFQVDLTRICERSRRAGLSEDKIKEFASRWLQEASVAELEETVEQLDLLEKRGGSDAEQRTEVFNEFTQLMDRIGQTAERPEMAAILASGEQSSMTSPKYPNIEIGLADLDGQIWPILRRVSYAMSDAGVDDAEIDQYEDEVRSSRDSIGVSSRWMRTV